MILRGSGTGGLFFCQDGNSHRECPHHVIFNQTAKPIPVIVWKQELNMSCASFLVLQTLIILN